VRPAFDSGKMAELAAISERKKRRVNWLRQLYQWHWISSGICLIGMVLFALTGLTLNHAGQIEARPVVVGKDATLPPAIVARLGMSLRELEELRDGLTRVIDASRDERVSPEPGG